MASQKNIQLMLDFIKALFLVLNFSYYTLLASVMRLSVTLLSVLMILFSILSAIRHLICSNNLNWLLNLNLIYETLWTAVKSGLFISILDIDGCFLEEKLSFEMLGLTVSSKLDWSSLLKLPPRKLES